MPKPLPLLDLPLADCRRLARFAAMVHLYAVIARIIAGNPFRKVGITPRCWRFCNFSWAMSEGGRRGTIGVRRWTLHGANEESRQAAIADSVESGIFAVAAQG
jgi:hypothetical protein